MFVPDRPATLFDVAARAGVGKSTVSNVLQGKGRFAEHTREAVLAAARELGYVPNPAARWLRGGRTGTIGVHLPQTPTASAYYMEFVFGVLEHAAAHDRDVTVLTGGRVPRVDGFVVSDPMAGDPFTARLLDADVPVVTCEDVRGSGSPDGVVWADHGGAMRGLLDTVGARRPALLVPPEDGDWAARLGEGYRAWCAAAGVPERIARIDWIPTTANLEAALDDVLAADPDLDTLVCGPVDTAALLLPALRARGIRVGADLRLACATDSPACALTDPPITAVDQAPRLAGRRCAELLEALLDGTADAGTRVEVPLRIVRRASA
ncbi:MAG: LacI family transcriptional regulator [Pseudonocardiaceae bacterium]|nr:MAG: LacI family transcriptional regulator [Pseudonocardiaceae bacterium]